MDDLDLEPLIEDIHDRRLIEGPFILGFLDVIRPGLAVEIGEHLFGQLAIAEDGVVPVTKDGA